MTKPTTKQTGRKEALKAQLASLIEADKRDHETRIYAAGRFLFPPDAEMEGEPVSALKDIAELIARQPVEALNKLIDYTIKRRDELVARCAKKSSAATRKKKPTPKNAPDIDGI